MAKCASCGKEFEFPNYLMPPGPAGKGKEIYPTCPYCGFNLNEDKRKRPDARSRVEKLVGGKTG
jgi:DNA-directed RNA polymerase subunit RPC12/RpoP